MPTTPSHPNHRLRNGHAWRTLRTRVLAPPAICHLCGRPGATTVDHIVPLALGGTNAIENLAPAHGPRQPWGCPGNYGRGTRPIDQVTPGTPTRAW